MFSLSALLNKIYSPPMVISFVGAGGKTTAIFNIAEFFSQQKQNIAITTTTLIFDPKCEQNRHFDEVITNFKIPKTKGIFVFGKNINQEQKLTALSFNDIKKLSANFDLVLVEADGAKKLPVKAPDTHEPVIPDCSNIVVGVIGLNCLNKPLNHKNVHRPELFAAITNCQQEEQITPKHLIALVNHHNGLFKNCPYNAKKIVFFNQSSLILKEELDLLYRQLKDTLTISFFL